MLQSEILIAFVIYLPFLNWYNYNSQNCLSQDERGNCHTWIKAAKKQKDCFWGGSLLICLLIARYLSRNVTMQFLNVSFGKYRLG
jgi:hypothetical protein